VSSALDDHDGVSSSIRATRDTSTPVNVVAGVATARQSRDVRYSRLVLSLSERGYEQLLDEAPVVVLGLDANGHVANANRFFLELTGLPLSSVQGAAGLVAFLPARAHEGFLALSRASGDGAVLGELLTRDGEQEIAWRVRRVKARVGETVTVLLGTLDARVEREVASRRRAEEEAATHSHVLMNMTEAVQYVDAEGVIHFTNPAQAKMFGYEPDELVGQHVSILNEGPPEERARVTAEIQAAIAASGTYEGEVRNRRKDGSVFWARVRVMRIERDGKAFWVGLREDVTERRAAAEEVRRMRDLLRDVVDSSPDFIFVKDRERRFLVVNEAFARARESRPAAMVGRPDREFTPAPPTDVSKVEKHMTRFRDDDAKVFQGWTLLDTYQATERDGIPRFFEFRKSPLRDDRGAIYGLLCHVRDVTDERAADERRRRSLAEKETLLREIHHRVKNNLQVISGLMYFQAKKVHDPRDVAAFAEGRTRLIAMMLVHDKLYQSEDLSRVDLGDYARGLVRAVVASLEAGGHVDVEVDVDTIQLPAETALSVGMIVCELLTNVYKHSMAGRENGRASIRVTSDRDTATIVVRDDGNGFPVDFDVLATTSFGWHLVREIVAQLDGSVTTSSDNGACVHVSFPLVVRGAAA
jgi:PAS domain S-box-containing protein